MPQAKNWKPGAAAATAVPTAESVAGLAWAGQQAQAIAAASVALEPRVPAPERLALLDLRAESRLARGHFDDALADAQAMQALARALGTPEARARALCRLALVQTCRGADNEAAASARRALAVARKADKRWLEALALFRLAEALWRGGDGAGGLTRAKQATLRFGEFGDAAWRGRSVWSQACALADLGHQGERAQAAQRAPALAEQTGDRVGLGCAYNLLLREHPDLALRLKGLQQSLAAFGAAGNIERQHAIRHILALAYVSMGLYRRARRRRCWRWSSSSTANPTAPASLRSRSGSASHRAR
jgi:hypothetical protein